MTTANKIIRMAMGNLGLRTPGQDIEGDDAIVALEKLNAFIDANRLSDQMGFASANISATLGAGQATIFIGASQALNIAQRPVRILDGSYVTVSGVDYLIKEVTAAEYAAISTKTVQSAIPEVFEYTPSVPYGEITVYPVPSSAITINILCEVQTGQFADLATDYVLSAGVERLLHLNLAIEIGPDFEREAPPSVVINARQALHEFKCANIVPKQIDFGSNDRIAARRLFGL
jgi:hypothetical protein